MWSMEQMKPVVNAVLDALGLASGVGHTQQSSSSRVSR
jgi:hypothetical protein